MSLNGEYLCSFCNKEFSTKSSLNLHKKTAKYCLEKQGANIIEFKCDFCNKILGSKQRLNEHTLVCDTYKEVAMRYEKHRKEMNEMKIEHQKEINEIKIEHHKEINEMKEQNRYLIEIYKNQIEDMKEQINDMQNKLFTIASKPQQVSNTTKMNIATMNIQNISEQHINEQVPNLTIDHIKKGAVGYTEYFLDYPLKERIICSDFARKKLKYRNEDGDWITDPELTKLSELLFNSIKERNRELTEQYMTMLTQKLKSSESATRIYFEDVLMKFAEQDIEVSKMLNGDKNDFFHEIIRNICCKTIHNYKNENI
jgi:hypothetical protein